MVNCIVGHPLKLLHTEVDFDLLLQNCTQQFHRVSALCNISHNGVTNRERKKMWSLGEEVVLINFCRGKIISVLASFGY